MIKEKRHSSSLGVIASVAIVLAIAGCSRQLPPGERNNYRPFGVEHATLHFEYFGNTRGTEDLYEDSSGLREAHLIHSELITEKGFHPIFNYTVRNVGQVTIIDSVKMLEIRMIDKMNDSLFHLPYGDVPTSDSQFSSFFGHVGYTLRGDTNIVANNITLKAHVWQLGDRPTYIYEFKGLLVGRKSNTGDLRLLSIDTTTPVDPARFEPPHGFPVMDRTKAPDSPNPTP